jgi:hypothetical protein
MVGTETSEMSRSCEASYEAPRLVELGAVSAETRTGLHGCYWNKQFGGSDGWTFMGISVPISNCSS